MKQTICGDHAVLQQFAEGALTGDESGAVRAHLGTCPACRLAVSEYKQVMWDLSHPSDVPIPAELEQSYERLMQAWQTERRKETAPRETARSLVPAWAGYSVRWTRRLPAVGTVGSLLRRTGSAVIKRALPRRQRRTGGGNH